MREEAKKRDHKILGPALDLFTFSELVGSGLPLWTPKGTLLRNLLDEFVWSLRSARGYERVEIPHITKKDLYVTSGHWAKYQNDLFKITTREGHIFAMKPMNCPHHTQIYARRQWSYRELPQRYANTTMCYRDEQTGELSGLSRARSFTQDDAHVFCRLNQVKEEFLKVWDIIHEFYQPFGFALKVRLSLHDPAHQEKYLGEPALWDTAENMLREIVAEKKVDAINGVGEAAFYGPKLDFMANDSLGREWQVATIQLDMNMPENFDLICINEESKHERIVMIHCAIMGSIERFLSILIEHTAGALPLWLAPVQVSILPISDKHADYAATIAGQLRAAGVRAETSSENETIGKKIRESEKMKIPYAVIVGDKDIAAEVISVRKRGGEDLGQLKLEDFLERLRQEITDRA
jgi:threonyl-tRNA synthetase